MAREPQFGHVWFITILNKILTFILSYVVLFRIVFRNEKKKISEVNRKTLNIIMLTPHSANLH
jgi:hypothetical protein